MRHLTPQQLDDLLDPRTIKGQVKGLLVHLREVCPQCAHGYRAWAAHREALGLSLEPGLGVLLALSGVPAAGALEEPDSGSVPSRVDDHLTPELLDRLAGVQSTGTTLPRLVTHLMKHCATCEMVYDAWNDKRIAEPAASYREAVERAVAAADAMTDRVKAQEAAAADRLRVLLALPPRRRLAAVRDVRSGFAGPALADLLIAKSRECLPGQPQESFDFACLAAAALRHAEPSSHAVDLYALANARIANAIRVQGRLPEAAEIFSPSRYLLDLGGSGDPLLAAELDELEGSLFRDQRRFEEAEERFRCAERAYQKEQSREAAARVLVTLESVYRELGEFDRAIRSCTSALHLLEDEEAPHLAFYARHNLAHALCAGGRYSEAQDLLAENRDLAQRYGDALTQLRITWAEGKVARGLGDLETAEALFSTAQQGFRRREVPYDTALVTLELADLYLQQGRTREVRPLAAELVQVFEEQQVNREAMAALLLFRDAVELERVSTVLVRQMATYLRRVQRDPSYAFQDAS
ncbi:MAG: hypothetical protein AAF481_14465 [Acidobacteriota bacterium]